MNFNLSYLVMVIARGSQQPSKTRYFSVFGQLRYWREWFMSWGQKSAMRAGGRSVELLIHSLCSIAGLRAMRSVWLMYVMCWVEACNVFRGSVKWEPFSTSAIYNYSIFFWACSSFFQTKSFFNLSYLFRFLFVITN